MTITIKEIIRIQNERLKEIPTLLNILPRDIDSIAEELGRSLEPDEKLAKECEELELLYQPQVVFFLAEFLGISSSQGRGELVTYDAVNADLEISSDSADNFRPLIQALERSLNLSTNSDLMQDSKNYKKHMLFMLGKFYEAGEVVEKNALTAEAYYKKSAEAGYQPAINVLEGIKKTHSATSYTNPLEYCFKKDKYARKGRGGFQVEDLLATIPEGDEETADQSSSEEEYEVEDSSESEEETKSDNPSTKTNKPALIRRNTIHDLSQWH